MKKVRVKEGFVERKRKSNGHVPKAMQAYAKERDEALLSLDKQKILEMFVKHGEPHLLDADDETFWYAIHMARLDIPHFSEEVKEESRRAILEIRKLKCAYCGVSRETVTLREGKNGYWYCMDVHQILHESQPRPPGSVDKEAK